MADTGAVVYRVLVFTSLLCCGLVVASFLMFGRDQVAGASKHQQNELVAGAQVSPGPVARHQPKAQPRAFIDGAAHSLTAPFSPIVSSSSAWVAHAVSALLALLVYGVGLGFLARYSHGTS